VGLTGRWAEAELLKLVETLTSQASVALLTLEQGLQEPKAQAQGQLT
jgi:hypothetical protein